MSAIIPATDIPLPKQALFLPLYERPVFPGTLVPLFLENAEELKAIETTTTQNDGFVVLSYLKNGGKEKNSKPTPLSLKDFHSVGTLGKILRIMENPNPVDNSGKIAQIIISTVSRIRVESLLTNKQHFPMAKVSAMPADIPLTEKDENAYAGAMFSKAKELIKLNSLFAEEMKIILSTNSEGVSSRMIYLLASLLSSGSGEDLQKVLAANEVRTRFELILELLQREIEVSRIKEKINKKIEGDVSKQQRDFFLREQLKQIKKELGIEEDEKTSITRNLRQAKAKLKMNPQAERVFEEEMAKLESQDPRSQEYTVVRNYLDWLVALPWGIENQEQQDIGLATKILDRDHYGMDKIKEKLLTLIAIRILKKSSSGQVITLVGPPGVGKTSLGKSVAKALGREFYRFSLGGMRDEAEVRGHRRTYVGAMPGKFIQAMKYVKTNNPIIMLDEIDKVSSSYQGDPSSALLEVLDKEQNDSFFDLYLDVPFDFSKTIFIATANQLDTIPRPLLDRMEVVELSGYLPEEKRQIARRYFIPKLLGETGLGGKKVQFSSKTIDTIINGYARESGVRGLERQIKNILAKISLQIVKKELELPVEVSPEDVEGYLGKPYFSEDSAFTNAKPGIVTGLAWTAMGGATFTIESLRVSKGSGLKLTGSLGKVMEESAQLAFSYVKSLFNGGSSFPQASLEKQNDAKKGTPPNNSETAPAGKQQPSNKDAAAQLLHSSNIHLHVPSGATPKDGPSAGIAMALALYSLATGKKVPTVFAMTGELTLSGRVFPIGGLREKTIAGKRAGKKELIVPESNRKDIEDLPTQVKRGLKFHFVSHFEEVLKIVFAKKFNG